MPKLKTHRGAAKRQMRGTREVSPGDAPKLKLMLPYKGSGF